MHFRIAENILAVSGVCTNEDLEMRWDDPHPEETELATSLQRMWPHREHESGVLRSLMCFLGAHLWLAPDYTSIVRRRNVRFCLWCSCVEIDGRVYR